MEEKKPTHRKHNRWHDYSKKCIYHITLVVRDRCKVLGRIIDGRDKGLDLKKVPQPNGDLHYIEPNGKVWTEAELAETAEVEFTPLGFDIQRKIQEIPLEENKRGNDVQILGACVMPEHIHFVLYVRQPMAQNVGMVIRGFKQGCNKLLKKYLDIAESSASATIADLSNPSAIAPFEESAPAQSCVGCSLQESPLGSAVFLKSASSSTSSAAVSAAAFAASASFLKNASARILEEHSLFEDDFDETRLRRKGQLRAMIDYVHKNPVHRWLRANKPHWLLPIRGIKIAGKRYDAIGNILLLGLPRFQVHCRYRWELYHDLEARRAHQNESVMKARQGYVLISPFISPHEAAVRDFCLQEGHSIIQLTDNGFSDYSQCPGGLYDYCDRGQVLLLVPSELPHIDRKSAITRAECNALNDRAAEIAGE